MRSLLICTTILGLGSLAVASVLVDLTAAGGGTATLTGGTTTGTILDATSAPTTVGTGVIDSFVRLQTNGNSELGYNTDGNPANDEKNGNFTHSLLFSSLDTATKPGYVTFLLDINQLDNSPLLSLDAIQFYAAASPSLTSVGTPSPATLFYNLQDVTSAVCAAGGVCNNASANTHDAITLNYTNNKGSGNGFDMFLYVPTSVFAGVNTAATPYFYLYSQFGALGGSLTTNDGFEEWARFSSTGQSVPEPISSTLVGTGLIALFFVGRRRIANKA